VGVSHPAVFERKHTSHVHEDLPSFPIFTSKKVGKGQELVILGLSVVDHYEGVPLQPAGLKIHFNCIEGITRPIPAWVCLADIAEPEESAAGMSKKLRAGAWGIERFSV
jgi:hypothetical protein